MISKPHDQMVKYILIGDSNVGKTSIMRQFCNNTFSQNEKNTIGLDYGEKVININGQNVLVQLWDTAGQERFKTITPSYYRAAMGILLIYSVTDKNSFNSIQVWMKQIKQYAIQNIPILILANKTDIKQVQVNQQQSRCLSQRHSIDLLMTSAKTNKNIETAIIRLYHKIDKQKKVVTLVSNITLSIKKIAQSTTSNTAKKCKC